MNCTFSFGAQFGRDDVLTEPMVKQLTGEMENISIPDTREAKFLTTLDFCPTYIYGSALITLICFGSLCVAMFLVDLGPSVALFFIRFG